MTGGSRTGEPQAAHCARMMSPVFPSTPPDCFTSAVWIPNDWAEPVAAQRPRTIRARQATFRVRQETTLEKVISSPSRRTITPGEREGHGLCPRVLPFQPLRGAALHHRVGPGYRT